jgi:hypothetical protein
VLRVPIGLESRRRHGLGRDCLAAAAGAPITASKQLGLSNTRKGELLGTLVELEAARVCEERQPEVEFTVSATSGGNGGSVCGKARGGEVSSL